MSLGTAAWNWLKSFVTVEYDIPEEELEELRMTSTLEPEEICRLKRDYYKYTQGEERMSRDMFMDIPTVRINPLKHRIALCFGYEKGVSSLDFPAFLNGVAMFNSHGRKEEKLKLAFRIQYFDEDGKLSRDDLKKYLETVTGQPNLKIQGWSETAMEDIINITLHEVCADDKKGYIDLHEFIRAMHTTDFYTKLQLSI
jgi:Ca2+-binding EF-hand superfamily protein